MVGRKAWVSTTATIAIVGASVFALSSSPAAAAEPTWFDLPVADSFPQGITAGPDGATWVASRFADQIVRVTPEGSQETFGLRFGVDPYSIASGSGGALWFTEHNGASIGRLTTGGALDEFPLRDRSNPAGITAGPDGAMWFTQRGVSSIGRIDRVGTITEWGTPTPRAAPLGIAAGSDGSLWFTETSTDAIGRITTDGTITEFALPAGSNPQWIAAGPDGALWFTERGTNAIGRITVLGGITHHPVSTAGAGVNGITAGPDGAVWFTESIANAIGRIGMHGSFDEFPIGEGAMPTGIATGPDGQVWFSAPGLNRIGKLPPGGAPADRQRPWITIVSPPNGSILEQGARLLADYSCGDEAGGSGLASCVGPVATGAAVDTAPGAHTFTVAATDVAGNTASLSTGYVVFAAVGGPVTNQQRFAAGRVIPITLELGSRPPSGPIFAGGYPVVRQVDCDTHETVGADEAADVQANITGGGRLMVQWRTGAGWAGTCRSLVLRFAWNGWTDADASFTLRFF